MDMIFGTVTKRWSNDRVRRSAGVLSVISLVPHVFCCFLPTAAALMALGTTVGLAAAMADNPLYRFVDAYHPYLLAMAIAAVAVSGLANLIAWRLDCRQPTNMNPDGCHHHDCTPKKRTGLRIFAISLVLLVLDIGWFAFEHSLGLHTHDHAAEVQAEVHGHHHH